MSMVSGRVTLQVVTVVSVVTLFDVVVGVECVTWAGPETKTGAEV